MSASLLFAVVLAALLSFGACSALTRVVRARLLKRAIMDVPNERSMHKTPTPRGGGLAVMAVVGAGLAGLALYQVFCFLLPLDSVRPLDLWLAVQGLPLLLPAVALLLGISWLDDKRGLSARMRLGIHLLAALIGSFALAPHALLFGGLLPAWLDRAVIVVGWAWYMNLTNFMDGIDGLTGVQTICVVLGATALPFALDAFLWGEGQNAADLLLAAIMAGACGGFLRHNWHPAKIFLGDVGSVPLGFLTGYLLLVLATSVSPVAALILPLYYLADSGITITKRALRGEKIWQPHRQHFYQRAAAGEGRHDRVVLWVLAANLALAALAAGAFFYPLSSAAGAAATVALLLFKMHKSGQKVSP